MTLKISQLNLITGLYQETNYIYLAGFGYGDSRVGAVKIEVTTFVAPYVITFSVDEGTTWHTISLSGDNTDGIFIWTPTDIEWGLIFAAGDPVVDYNARTVWIRVTDSTPATETKIISAYRPSMFPGGIKPNSILTGCDESADDTVYINHLDPIYYMDGVVFEAAERWYSETATFDLYIEDEDTPGTYTLLKSGIGQKALTVTWIFSAMYPEGTTLPLMTAASGDKLYRLHFIGVGSHAGNKASSDWFAVSSNTLTQKDPYGTESSYASRTDMYSRLGIEKGIYLDESTAIGQFEAGKGIVITQRNNAGKRTTVTGGEVTGDITDYKKAYNLVIEADISELPESPRMIRDWFEITEAGSTRVAVDADGDWQTGFWCMGSAFVQKITHSWNFVGGYEGNLRVDVCNVMARESFTKPTSEIIPQWEVLDKDNINVYVVIKNDGDFAPTDTKDDINFTLSNNLGGDTHSRWFYYMITEVIPDVPTVDTDSVTGVAAPTANAAGEVIYNGASPVTVRGFCYKVGNSTPTTTDNSGMVISGSGKGIFTAVLTGLLAGTTYTVRAFATNANGTGYGPRILITT